MDFSICRAMEKLLYSRGDDRSIDSSCLQNTVKKLVSNLCETLICYRTHLRIEGTVGITIDDERAIVLHFGENIGRTYLQDDTTLKRSSYDTEKHAVHDNDYSGRVGESKQEARKMVAKTAAKDSVTSTALSEEPKMKTMPPIVTECQAEDNGLNVSSPSETTKVKHSPESNSSFCEPLDSLSLTGKSYSDRGQTAFGGRSELESATLLDMTTDILSNLFNNSGENREANLNNYYDRDRIDEPLQGCRLRQGSAIDALRQLYSKRFSSQGAETSTQQKYLDPDLYSGTQDHVASMSGDLTSKISNIGRKDCSQNQVLLRELLFQKANPIADTINIQQPPSKRRRFTHSNKGGTNTSIADLLIRNNSSSSISGQRSRLPAAFSLEEAGAASQRETSSPETGHSNFPPGMTFDQDTDSSNYKFSQLLFSLVDSKRHSINQLSPAISEARQSGSVSKNYDSTVYQTHASDMANVKQETDDSEYDVT